MKYIAPIGAADPDDPYIDGNPGTGTEGSPVPAASIEHPQREIVEVIEQAGLVPDEGDLTQLYQAIQALISAGLVDTDSFAENFMYVRDEKSAGTQGGTFTSGAWRTRDLTHAPVNLITGASLLANQITLSVPGTYLFWGSTPAYSVDAHQCALYNVTDAAYVDYGTNEYAQQTGAGAGRSQLMKLVTIAASKTFELRHRCQTTGNAAGFGQSNAFGNIQLYSEMKIWKVG